MNRRDAEAVHHIARALFTMRSEEDGPVSALIITPDAGREANVVALRIGPSA